MAARLLNEGPWWENSDLTGRSEMREAMTETPADHDREAVAALVAMAREPGYDFPGRVARVLAAVAGELGGSAAFVASRPGSWEAAALLDLIRSTAGYGDEYLPLPEWRTRAPEFAHEAYGLRVGSQGNVLPVIAAGHVDPRRMIAAACHYARHEWGAWLSDEIRAGWQPGVRYLHAAHAPESTEQEPLLLIDVGPEFPGAFPITILDETAPEEVPGA